MLPEVLPLPKQDILNRNHMKFSKPKYNSFLCVYMGLCCNFSIVT